MSAATVAVVSTAPPEPFPPMPYAEWSATKDTLHRFAQVVGKVRLAASPRRNHWWNVPFHVTGRGITTRPMTTDPRCTVDLDFVDHRLSVHAVTGRTASFPLSGQSVASFHAALHEALAAVGVTVEIAHPQPFDLPDAVPFAEDTRHASYDPAWATRYWQVLSEVNLLLEEFSGRFSGKVSPVHHFWHTFDIAVTRFSGRVVDHPPHVDPVTREAYSREVVSAGFWFGDPSFPEAAFYSYTAPEPAGLAERPLRPAAASWVPRNGSHLAILRYDDARAEASPRDAVLDFLESSYRAGAELAGWDVDALSCSGGATDPHVQG